MSVRTCGLRAASFFVGRRRKVLQKFNADSNFLELRRLDLLLGSLKIRTVL